LHPFEWRRGSHVLDDRLKGIAMAKLGFVASIATFVGVVFFSQPAGAVKPCARKTFETAMIKAACEKGGQDEAKTAMKAFTKSAKQKNPAITGCPSCHSKTAGDYPLKTDGLKLFKAAGGK
jgi:hypothetical protein